MRIGDAWIGQEETDPTRWASAVREAGHTATVVPLCLLEEDPTSPVVRVFRDAAAAHDVVIAEVGAWSNPISPDPEVSREAVALCVRRLALADALGASCSVTIAGSRHHEQWAAPHSENYAPQTVGLIARTAQQVIDRVNPKRTVFAIETMPYVPPDPAESAADLIDAVNRPGQFGIHFDPVNMLNQPRRMLNPGAVHPRLSGEAQSEHRGVTRQGRRGWVWLRRGDHRVPARRRRARLFGVSRMYPYPLPGRAADHRAPSRRRGLSAGRRVR